MENQNLVHNDLIAFETIAGSKSYGLSTPESDTDIKGVFFAPHNDFFGFSFENQISDETNDVSYYEIGRFFELLCKSNPTVLEMLFAPDFCVQKGMEFLAKIDRSKFLSRKCEDSFARYAFTQIKKARGLNKKISKPMHEAKKSILDFCYTFSKQGSVTIQSWLTDNNLVVSRCGLAGIPHMENVYALFYDDTPDERLCLNGLIRSELSTDLVLSSVPKEFAPIAHLYFNMNGYSKYCKEYKEYWDWVVKRNETRFQTTVQLGKNYDSKNMMHTFRLLDIAEEIALHQTITVCCTNRDELLRIKAGTYSYEDLLQKAEEKIKRIEQLYKQSSLPDEPDKVYAEALLIKLRSDFYRNALERA
jgi:hypothetical protein